MEWITQLQGQIVALDSAPLIYFIEQNPIYIEMVRLFFRALDRSEFEVITSVVTLSEVLVYPLRIGNTSLAQQYRDILFDTPGLTTVEVNLGIAETAAELRAVYNLRTPDAIEMATAIRFGASSFLTNDARLPSLPELQVLLLEELRQ
jgi:predicted nucleic acid-binding protein